MMEAAKKTGKARDNMVTEILKRENVQIMDEVPDWVTAVRLSVKPLVDGGYVEDRYADGIIAATRELGPYYILGDEVALLHDRPEHGVRQMQLGVMVLRKAVAFVDERHTARLLVTLAASDAESHLGTMRALASVFMDGDKIREILDADSEDEVYHCFMRELEQAEE